MKFKNLTGRELVVISKTGVKQDTKTKAFTANKEDIEILLCIPPEESTLPRVDLGEETTEVVENIPIEKLGIPQLLDLPEEEHGVLLIVSGMVAATAAAQGRQDCVGPGKIVRDKSDLNSILGILSLRQ